MNAGNAPAPTPPWPEGQALPLFPLRVVLFPEARLGLQVFEPRYLDLVTECMRRSQPFGVVCLTAGDEAGRSTAVQFEDVGTLAHIQDTDAEQTNRLRVRCVGHERFRIVGAPQQQANGLWVAPTVHWLPQDPPRMPGPAMLQTVSALAEAMRKLQSQGRPPFAPPYRLDDAGWVANRWCELLPLTMAAKQKLMALEDPTLRLSLVDGFLRDRKVVVG